MSYYLIDFSKKSNDFSFDNLIIGKRIKTDQDNSKYYIYYQSEETEIPSEINLNQNILLWNASCQKKYLKYKYKYLHLKNRNINR